MIEFVGLIKVNVVRGTNLAVRDIVTSDPYVILSLGHQVIFFLCCSPLHYSMQKGDQLSEVVRLTLSRN